MEVDEFLEHHGVKGMRWGIRRDPVTGIRPIAKTLNDSAFGRQAQRNVDKHNARRAARLSRRDEKWQKRIAKHQEGYNYRLHNVVADNVNANIEEFNSNPKYDHMPYGSDAYNKYIDDFNKFQTRQAELAVRQLYGNSPSRNLVAVLDRSQPDWAVKIVDKRIEHAAGLSVVDLEIEVNHDENGKILSTRKIRNSDMKQSSDSTEFLEHHGIKGMRWGIRRKPNPRTGLVTTDHKIASELRKKPLHSLTNKQLKTANERANLEQNFRRLNPTKAEIGRRRVQKIFAAAGITSLAALANNKHAQKAVGTGAKWIGSQFAKKSIKTGLSTIGKTL